MPATLGEAYDIQDAAIDLMGELVLGWKVAAIGPALQRQFGATRIAGPIFQTWDGRRGEPEVPMFRGGYAAGEAEFLLRIDHVPPTGARLAEVAEAMDMVAIGLEMAGSPFAEIDKYGPAVTVSDFGNNNGLVIGGEIGDWRGSDPFGSAVTCLINAATVRTGALVNKQAPLESACFLFELAAERGIRLRPGQWISSGAVTGAHPVHAGDRFEAHFGAFGTIACKFTGA